MPGDASVHLAERDGYYPNMLPEWRRTIEAIHAAPLRGVIVVTGGGASAISDLLTVPGGSRTVLEAVVPYSSVALTDWLGRAPEHYCSEETALAMAAVACARAGRLALAMDAGSAGAEPQLGADSGSLIGVACTAALVSDRPKKGEHRCHVAVETVHRTASVSLVLSKGARDRTGEESLVNRLILREIARSAGIADVPPLEFLPDERPEERRIEADPLLVELRQGRRKVVWSFPGGSFAIAPTRDPANGRSPLPAGVLCGAFNPLHYGHEQLRAAAESQLGAPVAFEISIANVDKPPLDYLTLSRRCAQFVDHPAALTVAPTFAEKAAALPGMTFVVGVDTAERIIQARYYGDSDPAMGAALAAIRAHGCRFLVAGRKIGDRFRTLADLSVPADFADLFAEIPATAFRADVSSTELRRGESGRVGG